MKLITLQGLQQSSKGKLKYADKLHGLTHTEKMVHMFEIDMCVWYVGGWGFLLVLVVSSLSREGEQVFFWGG